ncbi:60Kd inner membrane protein-domain-containing protein [Fimicolochytrium jonesii]|uniref:60Kd inner membrane protein-domain-containing protein n=1 Tax=Fimicolochytrium jonesii TaxID=1396493 RepID=UPI0022FE310B|nr:60Kd inner membrane protein-domain-containing protein [Fimicolochytrium jonesii]KAI8823767.1 60Kd inner membrane protein-domain-containing protein [Fimicolochytrium jonesii]
MLLRRSHAVALSRGHPHRHNRHSPQWAASPTSHLLTHSNHTPRRHFVLDACTTFLTTLHQTTNLPWYLTLITATLTLRTCLTLPLALDQKKRLERFHTATTLIKAWENTFRRKHLQGLVGINHTLADEPTLRRHLHVKGVEIYNAMDASPLKLIWRPLVQIPMWVCLSLSLRQMSAYPVPFCEPREVVEGFREGGTAWFVDLASADPTLIWPIALGAAHLLNVELNNSITKMTHPQGTSRAIVYLFRGLSLALVPVASQVPMALTLYWTTSAFYSVAQNCYLWTLARRRRRVKDALAAITAPLRESIGGVGEGVNVFAVQGGVRGGATTTASGTTVGPTPTIPSKSHTAATPAPAKLRPIPPTPTNPHIKEIKLETTMIKPTTVDSKPPYAPSSSTVASKPAKAKPTPPPTSPPPPRHRGSIPKARKS